MFLFPFSSVPKGYNVILYGAGDMGQQYIKQMELTGWANIIAIADQNWSKLQIDGVRICAPDDIDYNCADATIIAIEDLQTAEMIREKLLVRGVNNIVWQVIRYDGANEYCHLTEYVSYNLNEGSDYAEILSFEKRISLKKLLIFLKIYSYPNMRLIRIGGKGDGGYVMDEIKSGHIAYSIGVGHEISWDTEMVNRGFDLYMYDHTIDALPYQNEHFHFFHKGISGVETNDSVFCTIASAQKKNGHDNEKHMILKMDIEGAEWKVFEGLSEELLNRFDQMVFEIHGLMKTEKWNYYSECLEHLNKTHALVHVHGNNACRYALIGGVRLPDCLELTYVRRESKEFFEDRSALPRSEDYPNVRGLDEIELGWWNSQIDALISEL